MADDDGDGLERHKEMLQELRALRRGGDNGRPEA